VIYQRLGIPTVATVSWTTDQVMRRLLPDARPTEWTDSTGAIAVIERTLPAHWAGRVLDELTEEGVLGRLVAITRNGEAKLADPKLVGQMGDVLHLAVRTDALAALDTRLHEIETVGGH
jgi:trk system potassium uptake protein TrkA